MHIGSLVVVVAAVVLGVTSPAVADDAEQQFQQGVEAARAQDYDTALHHFEQARAAGLRSAALFFNLGVSQYQLGRHEAAFAAFGEAAKYPAMAALAHYNQALVAAAQGRTAVAEQLLRRTLAETDNPKLFALAESRLASLPPPPPQARNWYVSAGLGAGSVDDLVDPLSQAASTRSDNFLESYAAIGGALVGDMTQGLRAEANAYVRRYDQLSDYDTNFYQLSLLRVQPLGRWQGVGGVRWDQSTLGTQEYLRTGTLDLWLQRQSSTSGPGYRLRYRYSDIGSLDADYDPLAGTRQRADIDVRWAVGKQTELVTGYGFEVNDRDDDATADTFTSYSPTSQTARLVALGTAEWWDWEGRLEYVVSDYRGTNRNIDIRTERHDESFTAGLSAGVHLNQQWRLAGEWSHTDNSSNIDDYSYDQNVYSISLHGFY